MLNDVTVDQEKAAAKVTEMAKGYAHKELSSKLESTTSFIDLFFNFAKSLGIGGLDSIQNFLAGLTKQASTAVAELKPAEPTTQTASAVASAAKAAADELAKRTAGGTPITLADPAPPAAPLGQKPPQTTERALS
jgi:dsDNA-specific endonuclease/ATPase MutS2